MVAVHCTNETIPIFWVFNSPYTRPEGPMDPRGGSGTLADIVPRHIRNQSTPACKLWRESARGLSRNRWPNKKNTKTNTSPFALTSEWRVIKTNTEHTLAISNVNYPVISADVWNIPRVSVFYVRSFSAALCCLSKRRNCQQKQIHHYQLSHIKAPFPLVDCILYTSAYASNYTLWQLTSWGHIRWVYSLASIYCIVNVLFGTEGKIRHQNS